MSKTRLPYGELSPVAYENLLSAYRSLDQSSLGRRLVELIYLRVSQINGCAFCLQKHAATLRELGEETHKLDSLAGWQVSELYSARERAALAWAEGVTRISETQAPDDTFDALKPLFSDTEIADLTFAVALMNALNRVAISMRL
uniref:carboxymuconolactone decarboxylase family protein n=1 Tax=Halomonas sp. TaxID=1486246 RepID=UPI002612C9CD|nr:carboxymuconolactone decarboxylase family protein [Halomonas sp.]